MHRWLERPADYTTVWQAMQTYTAQRIAGTADAIWLCEHAPVYTLGQAGRAEHILRAGDIPIVQTDRGGQVTYHGPGQVVAYALIDLRRAGMYVKEYVGWLEESAIRTLADLGVPHACRQPGRPGVYLIDPTTGLPAKIAALGVKIRSGCAYHGVAINVDLDLAPFVGINPCGYEGLATTDIARAGGRADLIETGELLATHIAGRFDVRV